MAISFINSTFNDSASGTSVTVTENIGALDGDLILAFARRASDTDDADWVDPADFTQLAVKDETVGTLDTQMYLGYKIRGADAGSGYQFDFAGTAASLNVCLQCWRGVDPSSPIDVAYVEANHYVAYLNSITGAAQPITTVTDGAVVVLFETWTQSINSVGPPADYDQRSFHPNTVGSARVIYSASKLIAVAGTETPGVWTHVDSDNNADSRNFTIALRPASAATPKGRMLMTGIG